MAADPNWNLAAAATFPSGGRGLVLAEAKAHVSELQGEAGGRRCDLRTNVDNHDRVGEAISEARDVLGGPNARVRISRDCRYQFSNRLAFAWKFASEDVPTVLVYVGFTGDETIAGSRGVIRDEEHWWSAVRVHTEAVFSPDY